MEDKICIDTDIIIDHLRGKGPGVNIFKKIVTTGDPFTTYINKFELLCGARTDREANIINECLLGFTVLPFDNSSSYEAARIYNELKKDGRLIGIRDIMIAGIAVSNQLLLATKNTNEFKRIKGLNLWQL